MNGQFTMTRRARSPVGAERSGAAARLDRCGTMGRPAAGAEKFIPDSKRAELYPGMSTSSYRHPLPIDEASVRANLQNSLTGAEAGLVAYYQMSDGIIDSIPAAQLTDDSLHGNTGAAGSNGTFPTWVNSSAFDLPVIYPTLTFTPTFTRTRLPTFTPTATATQTLLPSPTHQVVAQPSGYQVFLPSINR